MSGFQPKRYQQSVLDSVEAYFRACHQYGNADTAFYETTRELWTRGSKYSPIAGFEPDMPYFCLRVPTGGGKTWLAAKSVRLVNTHLLRCEHSVILWLTPSKAIREQTIKALEDRYAHPTSGEFCINLAAILILLGIPLFRCFLWFQIKAGFAIQRKANVGQCT